MSEFSDHIHKQHSPHIPQESFYLVSWHIKICFLLNLNITLFILHFTPKLLSIFPEIDIHSRWLKGSEFQDLPSGLVAKIWLSQCWGTRFDPWSGNWIPHATAKALHGTTKDSRGPQQRSKILCAATRTWCSLILFLKGEKKKRSFGCNGLSAGPRPWPSPTLLLLGGTELSFHHLRFPGHLLMTHFDCVSQTLKI